MLATVRLKTVLWENTADVYFFLKKKQFQVRFCKVFLVQFFQVSWALAVCDPVARTICRQKNETHGLINCPRPERAGGVCAQAPQGARIPHAPPSSCNNWTWRGSYGWKCISVDRPAS